MPVDIRAAALVWLASAPAWASAPAAGVAVRLDWRLGPGAEACIDIDRLKVGVEEQMGRPVFTSGAPPAWRVEGTVDRDGDGFAARLALVAPDGRVAGVRDLRAPGRCAALGPAIVLAVALMSDLPARAAAGDGVATGAGAPASARTAGVRAPPGAPAPPPPAPETRAPVRAEETAVSPPAAARRPRGPPAFAARASLLGGIGLVPAPALGAGAEVRVGPRGGWWSVAAGGFWLSPREGAGASGVRATAALAGLAACASGGAAAWVRIDACLGGAAGELSGQGYGFVRNAGGRNRLGGTARLGTRVRLSPRVAVSLGVAGLVPIARPSFDAVRADDARVTLFRPAAVAALADLGLEVAF